MLMCIISFVLGANFSLIFYALILARAKEDKLMIKEVNRE